MRRQQRRGSRKVLITGTIACLAIAFVAAGLVVRVDAWTAPMQVEPDPLRIGDSGTYAFFHDGAPRGALDFQIDGTTDAEGSQGPQRSVSLRAAANGSSLFLGEHIGLADGQVVRREITQNATGFEGTHTLLGGVEPAIPHMRLSKAPISVNALDPAAPDGWTWWTEKDGHVELMALDRNECAVTYSGYGGSGFVDGRGAVGVSTLLECGDVPMNRTAWFTKQWPVPALVTFTSQENVLSMGLVEFSKGNGPSLEIAATGVAEDVTVTQSPRGATHPATGQAGALPYPIEAALEDVETSIDLLPLHVWLVQNPDAELAGARLMRGEHHWREQETDVWTFVYADPSGQGYQVATERARTEDTWWVTDAGTRSVDASAWDSPVRYVSLAGAGTAWQRVAGDDHGHREFNFVQWGIEPDPQWAADCEFIPEPTGLLPGIAGREQLVVGHSTFGSCTDPKIVKAESYAVLDASTGAASQVLEHRIDLPTYPEGDYPTTRGTSLTASASAPFGEPKLEHVAALAVPLLVVWWAFYFWPSVKLVLGNGGALRSYSRVLEGDPLKSKVRMAMVDAVRDEPGITASILAQRLGIGWGTLAHHTALLEKAEFIIVQRKGRYRHYFLASLPAHERAGAAATRSRTARRALAVIEESPGISQQDLATQLGLTPAGALWHVRRLEEAGLLRRERLGRRVGYFPQVPE